MPAPKNPFKAALAARQPQIGLWLGLANPIAAELCSHAGFDWLVVDGEHAPNDIPLTLAQLQAIGTRTNAVCRPPVAEVHRVKQLLDLGAQTILLPMIETAEQAALMSRAMLYPPEGLRGVGAALARASNYGSIMDYLVTANAEACLILQVETQSALANLDAIAATPNVDGVFIGPSDLAADMGLLGQPNHPEVRARVEDAIARILRAGKAPGLMTTDLALAKHYIDLGAVFVAVGTDVALLIKGAAEMAGHFKGTTVATRPV